MDRLYNICRIEKDGLPGYVYEDVSLEFAAGLLTLARLNNEAWKYFAERDGIDLTADEIIEQYYLMQDGADRLPPFRTN